MIAATAQDMPKICLAVRVMARSFAPFVCLRFFPAKHRFNNHTE